MPQHPPHSQSSFVTSSQVSKSTSAPQLTPNPPQVMAQSVEPEPSSLIMFAAQRPNGAASLTLKSLALTRPRAVRDTFFFHVRRPSGQQLVIHGSPQESVSLRSELLGNGHRDGDILNERHSLSDKELIRYNFCRYFHRRWPCIVGGPVWLVAGRRASATAQGPGAGCAVGWGSIENMNTVLALTCDMRALP